jgi:hypothetical protein
MILSYQHRRRQIFTEKKVSYFMYNIGMRSIRVCKSMRDGYLDRVSF